MTNAANDADDADQQSSISELIAIHGRERLFVHPLLWTQRQLHLLGCTFADGGILTPTVYAMPPSPRCTALMTAVQRDMADRFSNASKARSLATGKRLYGKWWSLIGLLQEAGHYNSRSQIQFRFASRVVAHLPCKHLVLSSSLQPSCRQLAQLGYVDLAELARQRQAYLGRRPNKQLRDVTPPNCYQDPYLVALVIALAQEQQHPCLVLVTNPSDTTWLHIYTSNISPRFLSKLDDPSRRPDHSDVDNLDMPLGMAILHRRLAFEPYDTLSHRLAATVQQIITEHVQIAPP